VSEPDGWTQARPTYMHPRMATPRDGDGRVLSSSRRLRQKSPAAGDYSGV